MNDRGAASSETRSPLRGAVLVTTDGSPASVGALRVAHVLAARDTAPLHVLAMLEPAPYALALLLPHWSKESEAARAELLLAGVREQMEQVGREGAAVAPDVRIGEPAGLITRVARESAASLVVAGILRRAYAGQIIGEDTILRVMRDTRLPVLAIVPEAAALPARARAAVDAGPSSLAAARSAASLLADGGTLTLVHARPPAEHGETVRRRRGGPDASDATAYLVRLRRELPRTVRGEVVVLEGDPARTLCEFAARGRFDLVAAGSHGRPRLQRSLIGSVAATLLHRVPCSVLLEVVGLSQSRRHHPEATP